MDLAEATNFYRKSGGAKWSDLLYLVRHRLPPKSATLPFVIPSEAEGSAVQSFGCNEFVIPTGA
jgi:hypothetical protein